MSVVNMYVCAVVSKFLFFSCRPRQAGSVRTDTFTSTHYAFDHIVLLHTFSAYV